MSKKEYHNWLRVWLKQYIQQYKEGSRDERRKIRKNIYNNDNLTETEKNRIFNMIVRNALNDENKNIM